MKKMLIIPMIFLMLIMMATSVMAATSLAEEIYNKGKSYGVTTSHKEKMERYFTNNPVTDEQKNYILGKADECIDLMDKAGVKDVTKLSKEKLEEIEAKVKDAANSIGLTITFDNTNPNGPGFVVSKNGKTVGEYELKSPSATGTTSSEKFVYTGANSTFAFASIAIAVVALTAVVKLRKNA